LSYSPVCGAPAARRSSGCAEQWESRESSAHCTMPRRPTALHGVAVLLFFPDHRLSNSACIHVDALGVEPSIRLHRIPMVRRETPHLALGAGGASSYRSVPGLARVARALPPTTWILHHFHLCRAVGCPTCSSCATRLRFPSARPASCATDRAHVASSRRARSRPHTYLPRARRRARTSSRQTGTYR
jgi:hypothetical protein